ncbi:MAG: PD-(D/E)XK nuclease domain-containing protein [Desulfovermiculus sp.]|nr:PD-(D/E)XK nuclease domain-containing protein [Desulfovermiculus sp.]
MAQGGLAKTKTQSKLLDILLANDLESLGEIFWCLLSPPSLHDWYRTESASGYEGYYAAVVYCYFAAVGLDVHAEEPTNQGRMDLVLRFQGRMYVMEFKVVEQAGEGRALEQIKAKGYAQKFAGQEACVDRGGVFQC